MVSRLLAFLLAPLAVAAVREVIPGPGLPSLVEIGVTSEELYNMTTPFLKDIDGNWKRSASYDPVCWDQTIDIADVADAVACYNYILKLGHKACKVDKMVTFCTSHTAIVGGEAPNGPSMSYCSDVAGAVHWINANCIRNGEVGGSQAAVGNGNLIVHVSRKFGVS